MAVKSRVRILEERAQRLIAQRCEHPMQNAIEALTNEEIGRLLKIKETLGPEAPMLELIEARH